MLAELAAQHHTLITSEDHALPGGFGSIVATACADLGLALRIQRIGVKDALIAHASRPQQLGEQHLDRAGMAAVLSQALGRACAAPIPFVRAG